MSSLSLPVVSSISGSKRLSMKSPAIFFLSFPSIRICLESNHSWGVFARFSLLFVSTNACHWLRIPGIVVMLLSFLMYKIERAAMEKRRKMQALMLSAIVALERVKVAYDQRNTLE